MNDVQNARSLRLAVIVNVYKQGILDEATAKELLCAPLSPGGEPVYDDSGLLNDPDALAKIAAEHPLQTDGANAPTGTQACGNCGVSRVIFSHITVEKCPHCGDDEIDLSAEVAIP